MGLPQASGRKTAAIRFTFNEEIGADMQLGFANESVLIDILKVDERFLFLTGRRVVREGEEGVMINLVL